MESNDTAMAKRRFPGGHSGGAGGAARTCVLYKCHLVNDETVFRFNHVRRGCAAMGYDLVWVLDSAHDVSKLPGGVDFFTYSFDTFSREMPFAVFTPPRHDVPFWNASPGMVLQFHAHHRGEYDRLWSVEYDACVFGEWATFFRQYENDGSDFIASLISEYDEKAPAWCWFTLAGGMSPEFLKWLRDHFTLCVSLNVCSRLSAGLLDDILQFCRTASPGSRFFEWVWATVARSSGYGMRCIESNKLSYAPIDPGFAEFRSGLLYHAVKLDICWEDTLKARPA